MLVQPQAQQTPAQNAGEGRLARLDRLAPQVRAFQLEQVEGIQEHMAACALATSRSNTASPFSSQATASPSIRQERTLSRFMASR